MSKKPKNEVEFETPEIEYETPKRESKPKQDDAMKRFLDELGGCWCGRNLEGCNGEGTRVTHLWKHYYNFSCPGGTASTTVKKQVREAAVKAGLIVQEDNSNG